MIQPQRTTARPVLAPGVWDIDPSHSSVEFVARHLFSRIRGRFAEFAGTIEVGADPTRSTAEVTIRAASIDTNNDMSDANLRNIEYLDVKRFPTLTFRSSGNVVLETGGLLVGKRVQIELEIEAVLRRDGVGR